MTDTYVNPIDAAAQRRSQQYLTFSLGDEVFGMAIQPVREIIQYGAITAVPLMPEFVRGVINLRGTVVPVIDLRARFGRTRAVVGKKTCVVIFDASREGEKLELGLMVDSVSEVVDMYDDEIELPPQFGTTINRDFILGIGKMASEFVAIVAPERAFSIEDMVEIADRNAQN
jgi:purine-binding chemotaxis protein CheW